VGSYWPHLSTVIDYVRRSMPFGNAGSLTDDEVYGVVAYILYSNDLIDDDFVLSNETAGEIVMPNADGFIVDDREETEFPKWIGEPCMTACKDSVEVTMRAMVLDVTPETEGGADAESAAEEAAAEEAPAEEVVVAAAGAEGPDPAMVEEGEAVFKKCKSCHQIGAGAKNRTGPALTGIVGHPAGAIDGFKYSKALAKAAEDGLVWDEATLSEFLEKPKAFLKGTKMSFAGLKKEEDRAALIAYLKSVTN
jgi:cytochrome c